MGTAPWLALFKEWEDEMTDPLDTVVSLARYDAKGTHGDKALLELSASYPPAFCSLVGFLHRQYLRSTTFNMDYLAVWTLKKFFWAREVQLHILGYLGDVAL